MSNHHRQTFAAARAGMPDGQWSRMLVKAAFGVLLASLFGWLLVRRLHDIPFDQTQNALLAVAPAQWLTAAFATVISFWAIGHYDGVIHRYLATGISPLTARLAGAAAIAVGQTLGLGVITGAIVRWRMLPGQNLWQATKFTSLVAVFFLTGWAIVTGSALLLLPGAPFKPLAACGVVALLTLTMLGAVRRRMWAKQWPNLFTITRLVALAAVDTLAAAMAFWVLCPPDLALPLISLLPAFLIAFGAGIVSGSPGGVGAFEITLLALLPQVPEGPLLGAVLAWRVVYFAIPAVIGAAIAIRGPAQNRAPIVPPPRATLIQTATRAETGLIAQGHLSLNAAGHDQAWLTGRTAHCLIGMLDPLISPKSGDNDLNSKKRAVAALIDTAASENRLAVIYKCTARTAVAARGLGLKLHPVAREAWLDPRHFSFDMPSRSGLRRKLRHAEKAGVTLQPGQGCGPGLSQVAAEWEIGRAHV